VAIEMVLSTIALPGLLEIDPKNDGCTAIRFTQFMSMPYQRCSTIFDSGKHYNAFDAFTGEHPGFATPNMNKTRVRCQHNHTD